jgi:hypothetical protein
MVDAAANLKDRRPDDMIPLARGIEKYQMARARAGCRVPESAESGLDGAGARLEGAGGSEVEAERGVDLSLLHIEDGLLARAAEAEGVEGLAGAHEDERVLRGVGDELVAPVDGDIEHYRARELAPDKGRGSERRGAGVVRDHGLAEVRVLGRRAGLVEGEKRGTDPDLNLLVVTVLERDVLKSTLRENRLVVSGEIEDSLLEQGRVDKITTARGGGVRGGGLAGHTLGRGAGDDSGGRHGGGGCWVAEDTRKRVQSYQEAMKRIVLKTFL